MDISVIMPVYNVEEEYLRESLDSLIGQTKKDGIEAILIDDGSTNGSGAVADEYAGRYDWIHVYHTENRGAGPARNTAIGYATGKYLAFLDSDDLLPDDIMSKMFDRAEHDGSEVVITNTVRFDSGKESRASIHKATFRKLENVTNVTKNPELIYDTISCNKLIRRDYWLENDISYPPTSMYEDIPVMTKVLLRAKRVSVIRSIGYKWRFRELESRSTTQKREQIENLQARLAILRQLDKMFEEEVTDHELIIEKQMKALRVDLKIYVNVCPDLPPEKAHEFMREMSAYIKESISDEAMQRLNPVDRKIYESMMEGDLETFVKRVEFRKTRFNKCCNIEKGSTMYLSVPEELFGEHLMENTATFQYKEARIRIQDIESDRKKITLTCQLYVPRMNTPTIESQEIKVSLCDEHTGEEFELPVTRFTTPLITKNKGTYTNDSTGETVNYNYDGAGFSFDLYPDKIGRSISNGVIILRYKNRYLGGITVLRNMSPNTRAKLEAFSFRRHGVSCTMSVAEYKMLKINIEKSKGFFFR